MKRTSLQQRNMITSEDIYQELCNKIEKLEYLPGEGISENELSEAYGTSRHMVRGAFSLLVQRRLLEVYPQRGSYVSLIDMDYIADILYLREAIEQEAIQRIIDSGDTDQVCDKMEENLEQQKKYVEDKNPGDEFYRLDTEFHTFILEAAGKKDIMDMLDDPYIHVRRWRKLELHSLMRVKELIRQHQDIVNNLRKKDRLEVRKSMHDHIDTTSLFRSVDEKTKNEYFYKR